MFSAKIRQIFLFDYKQFLITCFAFFLLTFMVILQLKNISMIYLLFSIPFFISLVFISINYFNMFLYIKKEINNNIVEFHKCDNSIARFNKNGSFHNHILPTFEKDNKSYFLKNKQFIQCNSVDILDQAFNIHNF